MRFFVTASIFGLRLAPVLLVIYWGLLFTGTHLPRVPMPPLGSHTDKVMHFTAFAGLAFLLAWALPARRSGRWRSNHVVLAAVIAVLYAFFDEATQGLVPGRSPDWWDIAADVAGVAAGLTFYVLIRRLLRGCGSNRGRSGGQLASKGVERSTPAASPSNKPIEEPVRVHEV
jgi:VanZ family protein